MEFLFELWLPMLLSTLFVFIASCVLHMLIPIHRADYKGLSNEGPVLDALRAQQLPPGDYYFPWVASMKEMRNADFLQKRMQGPVGIVTLMPSGPPSMGKNLLQWVLYTLAIAIFTAYIGELALVPGADFEPVFRVTTTAAFMAFGPAYVHNAIWKGGRWGTTFKYMIDGAVYAVVMGATFGWLWPAM
jgi:hypothetical protein